MANYYPLISEAVAGLDPHAPRESRRILYERARAAQLSQLRIVSPPLSETEITRERLALEEAIRKVEREAAKRARDIDAQTLNDLATTADNRAVAQANRNSSVNQAKALVGTYSSNEIIIDSPSMIVTGAATGRLVRFWRWRLVLPGSQRARFA
jgi:hypothetical protein